MILWIVPVIVPGQLKKDKSGEGTCSNCCAILWGASVVRATPGGCSGTTWRELWCRRQPPPSFGWTCRSGRHLCCQWRLPSWLSFRHGLRGSRWQCTGYQLEYCCDEARLRRTLVTRHLCVPTWVAVDGHFLFSQSANLCNLAYIKMSLCFYPCPRVCVLDVALHPPPRWYRPTEWRIWRK